VAAFAGGPMPGLAIALVRPISLRCASISRQTRISSCSATTAAVSRICCGSWRRGSSTGTPRTPRVDHCRLPSLAAGLWNAEHVIGYAPSATATESVVADLVDAMRQRFARSEYHARTASHPQLVSGSDVYLVVDDYDLVVTPSGNPLLALLDVLPQSRDIGLHVVTGPLVWWCGSSAVRAIPAADARTWISRLGHVGQPGRRSTARRRRAAAATSRPSILVSVGCPTGAGADRPLPARLNITRQSVPALYRANNR